MKTPQYLRRSRANTGEGNRQGLIAGVERKFPVEFCLAGAIKSVTAVTAAAGL
jgi:hypothetical protein